MIEAYLKSSRSRRREEADLCAIEAIRLLTSAATGNSMQDEHREIPDLAQNFVPLTLS